jgi:DNA-binding NarL/FixJ family response regulator
MASSSSMRSTQRIFVVDDHPLIRDGLAKLLNGEDDLEVIGSTQNAREAIDAISKLKPDLLIVDVSLEGVNGIELIKNVRVHYESLPVLVVSMHDENLFALRALRAGAQGYIMKRESSSQIVAAVRQVLADGIYLSEALNQQLIYKLVGGRESADDSPIGQLTDRELEVLQLLGHGRSTREIAEELHLSPKTIETHRMHLKEKLSLGTAGDLVRFAVSWVESGLAHSGNGSGSKA